MSLDKTTPDRKRGALSRAKLKLCSWPPPLRLGVNWSKLATNWYDFFPSAVKKFWKILQRQNILKPVTNHQWRQHLQCYGLKTLLIRRCYKEDVRTYCMLFIIPWKLCFAACWRVVLGAFWLFCRIGQGGTCFNSILINIATFHKAKICQEFKFDLQLSSQNSVLRPAPNSFIWYRWRRTAL